MQEDKNTTEKDILDDYIDEQGNIDFNKYLEKEHEKILNTRKLVIEVNFENQEKLYMAKHEITNLIDSFLADVKNIDGFINATAEYSMPTVRYGLENTLKAGIERLLAQDKGGSVTKRNYKAIEATFKEIWKHWPDKDKRGSKTKFVNHIINNPDSKAPTVSSRTLQNWIKNWKTEQA